MKQFGVSASWCENYEAELLMKRPRWRGEGDWFWSGRLLHGVDEKISLSFPPAPIQPRRIINTSGMARPSLSHCPSDATAAASANECGNSNDVDFPVSAIRLNLLLRLSPTQVNSRRKNRFILKTNVVSFKSLFHRPGSGLLWAVQKKKCGKFMAQCF